MGRHQWFQCDTHIIQDSPQEANVPSGEGYSFLNFVLEIQIQNYFKTEILNQRGMLSS